VTRVTRALPPVSLLFPVTLLAIALAVVVWPPHTVDGPAHLLGATALAERGPGSIYREFYRVDWFPTPNLGGTVVLAALVRVGSLRAAETAMLLACALGLPLALRYAIRAVQPASDWLALAAVPPAFGYLYFYGFYSFCLGLVLCLLCAGWTLRHAPRWTAGSAAVLAILLTLTWFTHLVPFALALVFVGAVVVTGPRTPRSLLPVGAAMLPGLALTGAYMLHTRQGEGPRFAGVPGLALGLVTLNTPLVTYTRAELAVSVALAALLVALGVGAVRGRGAAAPAAGGILLATVLATVLFLAAPNSLGVDFGLINERLSLFPVLFGVLWLSARSWEPRTAARAAVALAVAAAVLFAVRVPDLRRYDRLADEYASAARWVPRGATLVALRFAEFPPGSGRNSHWDPVRHLSSRLAVATDGVDVGHYEAVLDYFPAQFRADRDLRRAIDPTLGGLPQVPPRVDLAAAVPVLGRPIDVVLVVGGAAAHVDGRALAATRAELERGYRRVGTTVPTGLVEVWVARGRM
jgi:hypothetical protein